MIALISSSLAGSKSFLWAAGWPMTAQAPMATRVLDRSLIFLSLVACSSEEIAPSTKATSMGPSSPCLRRVLAYLKSKCLVQCCQWSLSSSVIRIVESSQQVKVNQPMVSLFI